MTDDGRWPPPPPAPVRLARRTAPVDDAWLRELAAAAVAEVIEQATGVPPTTAGPAADTAGPAPPDRR